MPVRIDDHGQRNRIDVPEDMPGQLTITLRGHDHHIVVGPESRCPNLRIDVVGHGCTIEIGAGCVLSGDITLRHRDTHVRIGAGTTAMGVRISLHEAGRITIGEDCMLSGDIRMDVSDMHSIIDVASGRRINPPADVSIGDHVWLGTGVFVTKGTTIGAHCIVGAKSVVTKDLPPNSLAAGQPARVLRNGVTRDRRRLPMDGEPPLA